MRRTLVFLLAVGMAVSSAMLVPVPEAAAGDSSSGWISVDAQDPDTWLGADTAVEAVQFAVDNYEVVNLLGTFDFGDGSVFIGHSVEILGAGVDGNGDYRTTILGGGWGAFASYADRSAQIAVKDIQFDGAEAALVVGASSYVEVTGSQFTNIGRSWGGYGIALNGGCWEAAGAGVSGEVLIKGNYFDNSPAGDFSGGVLVQCVSADTEVSDNVVENFQLGGIFVNSLGEIRVKNNTINPGSTPSTSWFRNGITVGSWWFLEGGQGVLRVTDNTITTGGHIADNGIVTEDYEQSHRSSCRIADNEITYLSDAIEGFGIGLLARSSNCKYKNNDIDGGGHELYAGVALYPGIDPGSPGGEQENNTFIGNEIHNATVRQAGVYIDSSALTENNKFKENELEDIDGTGFIIHGDHNRFIENELEDIGGNGFHLLGGYNLLRDNEYEDLGGECVVDEGVGNRIKGEDCDDD